MKEFIKNISPFNNRTEMPALILIVKKLLMFIICYWMGLMLAEGAVIGVMLACGKNFMQGEMFSDSVMNLLKYYGMIVIIGVTILCWKLIERKKLSEMGVTKHIGGWLIGALIGVGLLAVCVAAIALTGSIRFDGLVAAPDVLMILLMLGGFIIQGSAEDLFSVRSGTEYRFLSLLRQAPLLLFIRIGVHSANLSRSTFFQDCSA